MPRTSVILLSEDQLSDAVLRRLVAENANLIPHEDSRSVGGFGNLKRFARAYHKASQHEPAIVLTDLDNTPCCHQLLLDWVGNIQYHPNFLLRIAVREVESWLFADPESLASYLKVPFAKVPYPPENEPDPQRAMFSLAKKSQSGEIRRGLPPSKGQKVGTDYNPILSEFVSSKWNPERASNNAKSLRRARDRILAFAPTPKQHQR